MGKKYSVDSNALEGSEVPHSNGTRQFSNIVAEGDNIDELIDNATVGVDDWHGNDLESRSIGELPARLYVAALRVLREAIETQNYKEASSGK